MWIHHSLFLQLIQIHAKIYIGDVITGRSRSLRFEMWKKQYNNH